MAELRAKYAEVRGHLEQNRVDDAHASIKELFEARRRFYNERHDRLNSFISPLLRSFCLAWKESIAKEEGKFDAQKVNFMNDFLEFCIASQKYDELEVVLQECRCPIKETRANSPDDIFWGFDPEETGAQGQLANMGAPETSAYWEDSRTYCRTWDAVTMKRVYPADPMFSLPFAVTVHPDRIEFADADQEQALGGTEFMAVLRRLHAANDWRILSAWGDQQYDLRAQAMARGSKTHRLWIFPDDIVDTKGEFVLVGEKYLYGIGFLPADHDLLRTELNPICFSARGHVQVPESTSQSFGMDGGPSAMPVSHQRDSRPAQ